MTCWSQVLTRRLTLYNLISYSIDDLLVAGINKASHIVIANRESDSDTSEERLADAEVVVAVHKIYR